jgi:hypothetical protein
MLTWKEADEQQQQQQQQEFSKTREKNKKKASVKNRIPRGGVLMI